jgi:hypothetical protein
MTSPAEELRRILGGLQRHEPPAIPLELLLVRLAEARRRTFAAVSATIAAGLILGLTVRSVPQEPPVHLDLHVVQVDAGDPADASQPAGASELGPDVPPGFDRP